jgi:NitT/TauT family transport system substrate-binding protein
MNEPVQMQASGEEVDVIYVADYANLVSNGLFTNEQTIEENPELVQGMVRAALRGIAFTVENPDEAFEISLEYIPQATGDATTEAISRAVLDESIKFWEAGSGQLGLSNPDEWQAAQRIMKQMDLVGEQDDVESMYTNQFIVEVEP